MVKTIKILIPILICFLVGFVASGAQEVSLQSWYPSLIKSPLSPPNIAFPIAWSILYLLMGLSIGLVLISNNKRKDTLVLLFVVQLILNFLWSILFFKMQNPMLGYIDIIALIIIVIWYIIVGWQEHRLSSILFIPYVVWIIFASYLNLYILMHN